MARRTRWIDTLVQIAVADAGQTTLELFNDAAEVDTDGWTVARVLGELWFSSASVAGAYGIERIDIGIGMVSKEAQIASAFPDPNAEGDRPMRGWMYRTRCMAFQNGTGTSVLTRCEFDMKVQRRVMDADLFLIVNAVTGRGTTFTTDINGVIRTLILLP